MSKFQTELAKHNRGELRSTIKATLDEESYQDFEQALHSPTVTAVAIVQALKSFGIEVSENTVRRWKKEVTQYV